MIGGRVVSGVVVVVVVEEVVVVDSTVVVVVEAGLLSSSLQELTSVTSVKTPPAAKAMIFLENLFLLSDR